MTAHHAILALLSLLIWLCAGSVHGAAADAKRTADELRDTVDRLNALDRWFSDAERKRATWQKEIKRQDERIAGLNRAVVATAAELGDTEAELARLASTQVELTARRQNQAKLIGEHLAAAHRLTGQDFFKQLLNQESPDTFERMIRYHRYFSQARTDAVKDYQHTLAELDSTTTALEKQKRQQTRQHAALLDEQNQLEADRRERTKLIAQLAAETETKSQEYDRLQASRERLAKLLQELRRRSTELDGSAFVAAKGNLQMPVAGRVRHSFGQRRANGRLTWHGLDISAPHGTPVTAIFRGRVLFSDWLRGFGLLTIVDHGSGYMTLYGNVDVLHKKVGDWVESGEIIAGAGNSGGKEDPGVYFEVRHNGQPNDPISWISR